MHHFSFLMVFYCFFTTCFVTPEVWLLSLNAVKHLDVWKTDGFFSTNWSRKPSCTCSSSPGEEGIRNQEPVSFCLCEIQHSSLMAGSHTWSGIHWRKSITNKKLSNIRDYSKMGTFLFYLVPDWEGRFVHLQAHQEGVFWELDSGDEVQWCFCIKADLHTRS